MSKILILVLLLVPFSEALASTDTTTVDDLIREELEFRIQDSAEVGGIDSIDILLKIEHDFNSDGILDFATTTCPLLCGNAGCQWSISLGQKSGEYIYLDELFFGDGAISIQRIARGRSKLYTYCRNGPEEGSIKEYELTSSGIKEKSYITSDTGNWDRFIDLCKGEPSPVEVYYINILEYQRTHELAWKPYR